jgi:DtxR family Mn-dependent transcriptional regulator
MSRQTASDEPIATSESEEMFLITVARAIEDGYEAPIAVPHIAGSLMITRVSVNEMAKKLVSRDLIEYEPYRGVTLTPTGTAAASRVLRRRRLWALFLAEHLGFSPTDADAVACEFEHVTPVEVEDRLASYLGNPTVDPEGNPIPLPTSLPVRIRSELSVSDLDVGARAKVSRVAGDPATRSFLHDQGVDVGVVLTLLAVGSDRGVLVDTGGGHVHLSAEVARDVIMERVAN